MSIYATLWSLMFPKEGVWAEPDDLSTWVEVTAQAVPGHIRDTGPDWDFLPPPVDDDDQLRAVVFITPDTPKATPRNGQEFVSPLLTLSGAEYLQMSFDQLHAKLCDILRNHYAEQHPE